MGRPSYSTPGGVNSGGISFKAAGDPTCPADCKKCKPSEDQCRCCSGDSEFSGKALMISNSYAQIVSASSIKLI